MTVLAPLVAAAAAGLALPSLVALYLLRRRRREVAVPSTLLWRSAVEELRVHAPFRRFRQRLLFWLQMLVLLMLLAALAQPAWTAERRPQRLIVALDRSASMAVRGGESGDTRLARAKRRARHLIARRDPERVMVVRFARDARVVHGFDASPVRAPEAVSEIRLTDQTTELRPLLELLRPLLGEPRTRGVIVSDGNWQGEGEASVPATGLALERVGADGPTANQAITRLAARRSRERPKRLHLLLRLQSSARSEKRVALRASIGAARILTRTVTVPPARKSGAAGGRVVHWSGEIPAGRGLIRAEIAGADALAADDRAAVWLPPPRSGRVLLVTKGNRVLEHGLRAAGAERVLVRNPAGYQGVGERIDLCVFDGVSARLPPTASLWFDAVPEGSRIEGRAGPRTDRILDWRRAHPLLRYVEMSGFPVRQPGVLAARSSSRVLAETSSGPIIVEVSHGGRRHAIVSFDPFETAWPRRASFAVFLRNALERYAAPGGSGAGIAYRPGDAVTVRARSGADRVRYEGPARISGRVRGGRASLSPFRRAGIYRSEDVRDPWRTLPVNLASPAESDLRPPSAPADWTRKALPPPDAEGKSGATRGLAHLWPWLTALALGLIGLEWLVETRRTGLA